MLSHVCGCPEHVIMQDVGSETLKIPFTTAFSLSWLAHALAGKLRPPSLRTISHLPLPGTFEQLLRKTLHACLLSWQQHNSCTASDALLL